MGGWARVGAMVPATVGGETVVLAAMMVPATVEGPAMAATTVVVVPARWLLFPSPATPSPAALSSSSPANPVCFPVACVICC